MRLLPSGWELQEALQPRTHPESCCCSAGEPGRFTLYSSMAAQGWESPWTPKFASASPPPEELVG